MDGRAATAARYPEELCKAICRGIAKEKMERSRGIRAVGEIDRKSLLRFGSPAVGSRRRSIDPEEFHERAETEVTIVLSLRKLAQAKPSQRGTSEALA